GERARPQRRDGGGRRRRPVARIGGAAPHAAVLAAVATTGGGRLEEAVDGRAAGGAVRLAALDLAPRRRGPRAGRRGGGRMRRHGGRGLATWHRSRGRIARRGRSGTDALARRLSDDERRPVVASDLSGFEEHVIAVTVAHIEADAGTRTGVRRDERDRADATRGTHLQTEYAHSSSGQPERGDGTATVGRPAIAEAAIDDVPSTCGQHERLVCGGSTMGEDRQRGSGVRWVADDGVVTRVLERYGREAAA